MNRLILILFISVGCWAVTAIGTEQDQAKRPTELQGPAPNPELEGKVNFTFDDSTVVEVSANAAEDMEVFATNSVETEDAVEFSGNVVVQFRAANGEMIKIKSRKAKLEH